MSQQQVADRLMVKPTALSNWENGTRAISIGLDHIDEQLDAGGALAGLLWAFGTPAGLEPSPVWTKVFPGESTPAWLWIRSDAPRLDFEGEWGVARVESTIEPGPNGLFMTVAQSVAESPIVVRLSERSWVDFGRGEMPTDVPGASVVPAIAHAARSSGSGTFTDMFFGNLPERFAPTRSKDLARLQRIAPRAVTSFLTAFTGRPHRPRGGAWPTLPDEQDDASRRRFAQLRQARGLSLVDLSNRLVERTGVEASKDTLRRFETDVGEPHDRMLPVALDHVLGADGRLALVELRADRGSGSVQFPRYWTGPVWFEFEDRPADGPIQFQWGDWQRELTPPLAVRYAYHYCEPSAPLRISAPDSVSWRVGVGRRAEAVAINQGWNPINVDVAHRAIDETERALIASLEQSRATPDGRRTTTDPGGDALAPAGD